MAVFASIYKHTFGRVFASSSPSTFSTPASTSKKRKAEADSNWNRDPIVRRRKREDSDEEQREVITKRRRVDADHFAPIVDGQIYESTAIEAPSAPQNQNGENPPNARSDRSLMPPPALSSQKNRALQILHKEDRRRTSKDFEEGSIRSSGTRGTQHRISDEFADDYDMERARRHASATTLPANSGVWERGEKELFYHLSYRGFEPLFPRNWMKDFPTMPLSLYQPENAEEMPLIQVYRSNGEFRAIRELRELLDLGKAVRDKVLASPGIKREAIIEKSVKRYITWAINDAGLKVPTSASATNPSNLPVHVVVKLKPHQTTTDCLLETKAKLHALRARHCAVRNIYASVEREQIAYGTPESGEEDTWIADSSEDDLPVLYGVMICKSLLAVFTLNSRVPAPRRSLIRTALNSQACSPPSPTDVIIDESQSEDDSASDPRFISDFDFSDPSKDVWNALVVAILAIQIRQELLLANESRLNGTEESERSDIVDASVMDVDEYDPDA